MEGEFNLMEAAAELTPEENGGAPVDSVNDTENSGQSQDVNPGENSSDEVIDPAKILEQLASEKPEEGAAPEALVEQLNALGMVHNGQPLKVESLEQVKELIQKGQDYTKKTMAHSEEVKAKEAAFVERESTLQAREVELNDVIQDNKIIESILMKWQKDDPDMFAFVQEAYRGEVQELEKNKPVIAKYENQFKELKDEISTLKKSKTEENHNEIKKGWETELGTVQAKNGAALKKIGVNVDWDKVKETWAADTTNKLTVEAAMYAMYGADISKANKSYQNLQATKLKTQQKLSGRTGAGSSSRENDNDSANVGIGNYEQILKNSL